MKAVGWFVVVVFISCWSTLEAKPNCPTKEELAAKCESVKDCKNTEPTTDSNGCEGCRVCTYGLPASVPDPCKKLRVKCVPPATCVVQNTKCRELTCPKKAVCVAPPGEEGPAQPASADNNARGLPVCPEFSCLAVFGCNFTTYAEPQEGRDCTGCVICPADPCQGHTCETGKVCQGKEVTCKKAPCLPQPECVDPPPKFIVDPPPPSSGEGDVPQCGRPACDTSLVTCDNPVTPQDARGCWGCPYCPTDPAQPTRNVTNPCALILCAPNKRCVVKTNPCLVAPCPQSGECEDVPPPPAQPPVCPEYACPALFNCTTKPVSKLVEGRNCTGCAVCPADNGGTIQCSRPQCPERLPCDNPVTYKDVNGCPTCPKCPPDYVPPPSVDPPAKCPQVRCQQSCEEFGYVYEGLCQTCACEENPCHLVDCMPDTTCELYWNDACGRPAGVRCPPTPQCNPIRKECPMMKCMAPNCTKSVTDVDENGCQGCPYCPYDPCANHTCQTGQVCRAQEVQCFAAPCYPQPVCEDPPAPCPEVDCEYCEYGNVYDGNCRTCKCLANPCDSIKCEANTTCEVEHWMCIALAGHVCPPPYGKCVPVCPKFKCVPANCSSPVTDYDERGCERGCPYCPPAPQRDPCANKTCPPPQVCILRQVQCVRAPCPPLAECADPAPKCPDIACPTIKCAYGLATGRDGCPVCQCKTQPDPAPVPGSVPGSEPGSVPPSDPVPPMSLPGPRPAPGPVPGPISDPCSAAGCKHPQICTTEVARCDRTGGNCGRIAKCVDTPSDCPPNCKIYCPNGNVRDSRGCPTCKCL